VLELVHKGSGAVFHLDARALSAEPCAQAGSSLLSDCPRYVTPLLVDEPSHRVFLQHAHDSGSNVPLSLVTLNLQTCGASSILETFGSGLGELAISPTGRYLAFTVGHHASACDAGTRPQVIDLESKTALDIPALSATVPEGPTRVVSLRWASATVVEVETTTLLHPIGKNWVPDDCGDKAPQRRATRRFDVNALKESRKSKAT
jgi:hypothetical protein